jgi:DNA polymerase
MATLSDRIEDYCFFDFETRAELDSDRDGDVSVAGTYRYAKNARPIILTYAIGDGPVVCLDFFAGTDTLPEDFRDFFARASQGRTWFVAWNTAFDRAIWNCAGEMYGTLKPEMTLDAMCQAMASNLPGDLQSASTVLGGPGKQKDGRDLIKLFSPAEGGTPETHPQEWERFKSYAVQDTEVLREVFRATRPLPRAEWEQYWVSERINERGIGVDVPFCEKAHMVHRANVERSNQRLQQITGETSIRVSTVAQLAGWVSERIDAKGRQILEEPQPDDEEGEKVAPKTRFDRARIGKLLLYLNAEHPELENVIEVLELREYGGSSSPVKFSKIVDQNDGNRLKGQYVFNGAMQTGRFSSRGVQIHNLPRASLGAAEENAVEAINKLGEKRKKSLTIFGVPVAVRVLFEQLTLQLWDAGWRRYSSGTILHVIRWHHHLKKETRTFKANSNWTAALARWIMAKHPKLEGFFELRELRSATFNYLEEIEENDDEQYDEQYDGDDFWSDGWIKWGTDE